MKTQSMHTNRQNMDVVTSTATQEQNIEAVEERKCPTMLTIEQTAEKSGLPPYTIRQWVKRGSLAHIMIGHKYLISWDRFCDFLNSNMGVAK